MLSGVICQFFITLLSCKWVIIKLEWISFYVPLLTDKKVWDCTSHGYQYKFQVDILKPNLWPTFHIIKKKKNNRQKKVNNANKVFNDLIIIKLPNLAKGYMLRSVSKEKASNRS